MDQPNATDPLDGAHNPAGMRALIDSLRFSPSPLPKKWKILFSAAKDKNVSEMLSILQEIGSEITICRMENTRSLVPGQVGATHASPLPSEARMRIASDNGFETYQKLVKELKAGEGLLVTGSLYLVGELKQGLA
jgi:dihydrofolate synthase/folylpolyglutamate synthase